MVTSDSLWKRKTNPKKLPGSSWGRGGGYSKTAERTWGSRGQGKEASPPPKSDTDHFVQKQLKQKPNMLIFAFQNGKAKGLYLIWLQKTGVKILRQQSMPLERGKERVLPLTQLCLCVFSLELYRLERWLRG